MAERSFSPSSWSVIGLTPNSSAVSIALRSVLANTHTRRRTHGSAATAIARARPAGERPHCGTGTVGSIVTSPWVTKYSFSGGPA